MEQPKIEQYANKGLTGLGNVGNSCYLNSVIQVLSHTYELNDLLNDTKVFDNLNRIPSSILLLEWNELRLLMWSSNCIIAPNKFAQSVRKVSKIKNNLFSGFNQNDAQEFLLFLIDCFHQALAREVDIEIKGVPKNNVDKMAVKCYTMIKDRYKKEYSDIIDIFFGISMSVIKSIHTGNILSIVPEPICTLNLPIPQDKDDITIFDCFDEYCKEEVLEKENAYLNETTGKKEDVIKKVLFWNLPNVLIIDIKRFDNFGRKISKTVDVPVSKIDLSRYVDGYLKDQYNYELYGICNHHGGTNGGHYTSTVKNANGKWYLFNDTSVKEVSLDKLVTNQSYCFFFRRV